MKKAILILMGANFLTSCNSAHKASGPSKISSCIQQKIQSMEKEVAGESPISITSYTYQQQTVYYIVSPCCDQYNIVLDSDCNVLGHPDGGFTGKGDGTMSSFAKEATNEKLIWKRKE
ncbi:MAG: hypothetical protein ABIR19_07815 [Ginsengibacter sp.]